MQLLKILAVDLGEKRNRRSDRKAPVNGRLNKKIYFLLNNTIHFNTYRDEDTIHIYKGVYTFLQISVLNIPFRLVQPPPPRTHTHAPTHINTRQDRKKGSKDEGKQERRKDVQKEKKLERSLICCEKVCLTELQYGITFKLVRLQRISKEANLHV